jgi:ribonuclease HII
VAPAALAAVTGGGRAATGAAPRRAVRASAAEVPLLQTPPPVPLRKTRKPRVPAEAPAGAAELVSSPDAAPAKRRRASGAAQAAAPAEADAALASAVAPGRSYEARWWAKGAARVAGVDEAGRGPLAGPVVAAACVIPSGVWIVRPRCFKHVLSHARALLPLTLP